MDGWNPPKLVIRGQLAGDGDKSGITLELQTSSGDVIATAESAPDGAYDFEFRDSLAAGRYLLVVQPHRSWRLRNPDEIEIFINDRVLSLGIADIEAAQILRDYLVVKVVDEIGTPISGVTVTLTPVDEGTDDDDSDDDDETDDNDPDDDSDEDDSDEDGGDESDEDDETGDNPDDWDESELALLNAVSQSPSVFIEGGSPSTPHPVSVLKDTTDQYGECHFEDLQPVQYNLTAETPFSVDEHSWHAKDQLPILIDPESDSFVSEVTVVYERNLIQGYVLNDRLEPLADFQVRLLGPHNPFTTTTQTDNNGYYFFHVLEGEYQVLFAHEVSRANENDVVWTLTSPSQISVSVPHTRTDPLFVNASYTDEDCCKDQVEAANNIGQAISNGFASIPVLNATVRDGFAEVTNIIGRFLPAEEQPFNIEFETLRQQLTHLNQIAGPIKERLAEEGNVRRYPKLTNMAQSLMQQIEDQKTTLDAIEEQIHENSLQYSNESRRNIQNRSEDQIASMKVTLELLTTAFPHLETPEEVARRLRPDLPRVVREELLHSRFTVQAIEEDN